MQYNDCSSSTCTMSGGQAASCAAFSMYSASCSSARRSLVQHSIARAGFPPTSSKYNSVELSCMLLSGIPLCVSLALRAAKGFRLQSGSSCSCKGDTQERGLALAVSPALVPLLSAASRARIPSFPAAWVAGPRSWVEGSDSGS